MAAKAPSPPDPKDTSAAQTGTSVSTAIANAMLGNVNQVTPNGNLTYSQNGSYSWTDPYTNQTYSIPQFTATQTLTPQGQEIQDQSNQTQLNLAKLANNQSAFLNDYLAKPVDLSNDATEARLFQLGSARLDPKFAQQEEQLRSDLLNRGIREGSPAYSSAMTQFQQGKNDAYNQLLLTGHSQAEQDALAQANAPINQITALLSGSQVSQPNFVNTQQPTIPTTDNAGIINQNYNQQLQAWQQNNSLTQSLLGGLFGLGSAFIMSDRRVKEDIKEVGKTNDGQKVYTYRYKGSPFIQMGLMAQDVERRDPSAVAEFGGIKHVNYEKALENAEAA